MAKGEAEGKRLALEQEKLKEVAKQQAQMLAEADYQKKLQAKIHE